MNTTTGVTTSFFTNDQKGVLPLAAIPCLVLGILWYKFYTREFPSREESPQDRGEYFYTALSAACLGEVLFHALPNATLYSGVGYGLLIVGFFVGYFVMVCYQKMARVTSSDNSFYISPPDMVVTETTVKGRKTNARHTHAEVEDFSTPQTSILDGHDQWVDLKKRRVITYITVVVLIFLVMLEGLFMIFNAPVTLGGAPVLVAMFFVNKLLQSVIFFGSLTNGDFSSSENPKRCWCCIPTQYHVFTLLWFVVIVCSTVFVLADVPLEQIDTAIRHPALCIFYTLAAGILFWVATYFIFMDRRKTDKRETVVRLLIFGVVSLISWTTGIFI